MNTLFSHDDFFMRQALEQAEQALRTDEVPIGAVVVDEQGEILSRAFNGVEQLRTQAAHAEMIALEQAGKIKQNWRLQGCWLYVTLEPCTMCMSLSRYSRLTGIVYAADSPRFGYRLDRSQDYQLYNVGIQIRSGVCKEESVALLKAFFQKKRDVLL